MKVLCVQSPRINPDSSLSYLEKLRAEISSLNFELMVLPEKWVASEFTPEEQGWSDLISILGEISREHAATVVPGSFSIRRSGSLYNTSPVIVNGTLQGYQDKIALFRNENGRYSRGSGIHTFSTGKMKFSVAVCYDLDFPFFAKIAIENGAQFLVNPSLIESEFREMWHLYVKGRSLENRLPVISVNSMSEPFNGGTIVTSMKPHKGGIFIETATIGSEPMKIMDTNAEEVGPYILSRKLEDRGSYGFNHKE